MARGLRVTSEQFICGPPDPKRKKNYMDEYCMYLWYSCGCVPRQKSQTLFWPMVLNRLPTTDVGRQPCTINMVTHKSFNNQIITLPTVNFQTTLFHR